MAPLLGVWVRGPLLGACEGPGRLFRCPVAQDRSPAVLFRHLDCRFFSVPALAGTKKDGTLVREMIASSN